MSEVSKRSTIMQHNYPGFSSAAVTRAALEAGNALNLKRGTLGVLEVGALCQEKFSGVNPRGSFMGLNYLSLNIWCYSLREFYCCRE